MTLVEEAEHLLDKLDMVVPNLYKEYDILISVKDMQRLAYEMGILDFTTKVTQLWGFPVVEKSEYGGPWRVAVSITKKPKYRTTSRP